MIHLSSSNHSSNCTWSNIHTYDNNVCEFLDLNPNQPENERIFFPSEIWNWSINTNETPIDYTNTIAEPVAPIEENSIGLPGPHVPIPVEVLSGLMLSIVPPASFSPHSSLNHEDVQSNLIATESGYCQYYSTFEQLASEEQEQIVLAALQALHTSAIQQAGFSFPTKKVKPVEVVTVGKKQSKLGCSFGHGVITSLEATKEYAGLVSKILDQHQVKACHWQSVMKGIPKHFDTSKGISNPNIEGVANLINNHFDHNGENTPYIHVCHSEGANTANEALKLIPEARRQNIHIISVGPSKYIDSNSCGSVLNIVNEKDTIAQKVDYKGYERARLNGNIRIVKESMETSIFAAHAFKNANTLIALEQELINLFDSVIGINNEN